MLRGAACWLAACPAVRVSAQDYPQTVAALSHALQRETDAHRRYAQFGDVASKEGYRGIAYMFAAFAVSEGVHASNFKGLLTRLGGPTDTADTPITPAATKENLITAVADEIDTIDNLYPSTLERMRGEGNEEAARLVRFAWQSEHQHRDLINRIRRYSPMMFERVAKVIDEKTDRYYVCQTCGSTLGALPSPRCPVCASPPERYRLVPVPA